MKLKVGDFVKIIRGGKGTDFDFMPKLKSVGKVTLILNKEDLWELNFTSTNISVTFPAGTKNRDGSTTTCPTTWNYRKGELVADFDESEPKPVKQRDYSNAEWEKTIGA